MMPSSSRACTGTPRCSRALPAAAIADLAAGPLPIAVMAWPGAATVAELTTAGVVRISLGSAVAQAAYGLAARAAAELFTTGTYDSNTNGFSYTVMNNAMQTAMITSPSTS